MVRLSKAQIGKKLSFITDYTGASNAASGSKLDANANVVLKNIATLHSELHKDINIQVNRELMWTKLSELYGFGLANEYIRQLEDHEIYCHDETNIYPYCVSISMYPFLTNGMAALGGESAAPKHFESYCGSFINLVFAISSQFAGAVATVEFLMHLDYFARKDFGPDYLTTHTNELNAGLQQVVYSVNQPAAARGYQSVFWNLSVFDKDYFESIFEGFVYPGTDDRPCYESVARLQSYFLDWLNMEREKSLLTFPVVTAALLHDKEAPVDKDFAFMLSRELSRGNSFFIYQSDSADSLASCCRVRNAFQEKPEFSYTLGAGGVATGSVNVMTINMNRLIQDGKDLLAQVYKIQHYQMAYRAILDDFLKAKMLPAYDAGYIYMDKQYSTIGLMGLVEAAEFYGITPGNNVEYKEFLKRILKTVFEANRKGAEFHKVPFNTELVPGESLGVKFAQWDKEEGYAVPRDCYNSYFYKVEDETIDVYDKFVLHGGEVIEYLDGGSALHLNLDESLSADMYYELMCIASKVGCNYWTVNVKATCCESCGHIDKKTLQACPKCGSTNITYATRVIGYLKKVSSFSEERQEEHKKRFYANRPV
jgi:ribonucleoside-triphosphate reductase